MAYSGWCRELESSCQDITSFIEIIVCNVEKHSIGMCCLKFRPPEEVDGNRKEATEENNKSVELNTHANEWPSQQHHQNATEKCSASLGFVPLESDVQGITTYN